ncbi:hypothetical protein ABW20_dc0100123 [Dactylellina cionopaga]|nr:hypothetical protein ABW20_dc0100123 [Dactylellina cionopaga]
MKAAIILSVLAAVATAAPSMVPGPKRCGGKSGLKCAKAEFCVGEKEIKGGVGFCLSTPTKPCGNFFGDLCPNRTDYCINDPRINCPPGVFDCGGGVCIGEYEAKIFGLKN